jgi:hypothetical protein
MGERSLRMRKYITANHGFKKAEKYYKYYKIQKNSIICLLTN